MMPSSDRAFHALQYAMVRAASMVVPAMRREEWLREWHSELWHVRRSFCAVRAFSWPAQREVTAFCLGSLQDALCLRREFRQANAAPPYAYVDGSAGQCLLRLGTLLVMCMIIACLLPGVQAERDSSRLQVSPGLLLIQTKPLSYKTTPTISAGMYRHWKTARQRYFDDFAFYRTVRETAVLPSAGKTTWKVSHASTNLFALLGLAIQFPGADEERDLPELILSHDSWAREFGADPQVAGRIVHVGQRKARVAGVLPFGSWRLPGEPDAWLLEADSRLALKTPSGGLGYLLVHLTPMGESLISGESTSIAGRDEYDMDLELYGVSIADRLQGPWGIYQFAVLLALLALPAVTSVTLGESNYSSHRPSRKRALYRWIFLGAKFALAAMIGYFASLDIAYWNVSTYSPIAELIQLFSCFSICLFGFRWALADQRHRCPVCLRRVTHPAQVGLASRTFLGWNGTEMICMGGHTLLHVPSLPTSWFSGQRWLYLDTSWEFLFADSGTW